MPKAEGKRSKTPVSIQKPICTTNLPHYKRSERERAGKTFSKRRENLQVEEQIDGKSSHKQKWSGWGRGETQTFCFRHYSWEIKQARQKQERKKFCAQKLLHQLSPSSSQNKKLICKHPQFLEIKFSSSTEADSPRDWSRQTRRMSQLKVSPHN